MSATHKTSLTPEPLLLHTERLHRVDARQLPQDTGVSVGHCRTDLTGCMHHAACTDLQCPGHPTQDPEQLDVPDSERDRALTFKVLAAYTLFLAAVAAATWQWLSR